MSRHPAPEENWGKDNSSLILAEQAKALPEELKKATVDQGSADLEAACMDVTGKSSTDLLQRLTEAERDGRTFLQTYVNPSRERSYKAFRNEHFQGSKYLSPRYKTRSKVFKPKTRSAVRKSQAAAAGALFASADVVSLEAQDNSSPTQRASAALKMELLNYRLDRTNGRDSIPWFLVSMGAHQDATIAGVCVSKQYWKFRERVKTRDEAGKAVDTLIVADRPDSLNIQPENVIIDPNCEWTRPAQTSSYFICRYPMPIHEVMAMMRPTEFANAPKWIPHTEDELLAFAGLAPQDVEAIRNARSGGADAASSKTVGAYRTLWVYENFLQIDGEDYTFWTIGNQKLLSHPKPTHEAYPEFFGERPYVIGLGALETHRPIPMSPAESWQQLQQEANDLTNLRLDQMKQVVTPVTKVRRGRQVDLEQVLRRGQDTVLMLTDMEDVEFDRPPDVPPSAMNESNILNNDFDELAGVFSQGSVATNRSLNETVGGMKMLTGAANSVTEFDLRVWVETWVEPVLWQLVKLEEWYESDQKILSMAGSKAELIEKYGISEITDQLLMQDCTLRVSAGIGAADPMQGLEKFGAATRLAGELLMPFIQQGVVNVKPKADEVINEVYGKAGYKGAFERFFEAFEPPQNQGPPPDPVKMAELELKKQLGMAAQALKEKEFQLKAAGQQVSMLDKEAERALKERIERLKSQLRMMEEAQKQHFQAEQAETDRDFQTANTLHQAHREDRGREFDIMDRERDRQFQSGEKDRDRQFQGSEKDKDRQTSRREALSQRAHQSSEADIDRQLSGMEAQAGRQFQGSQADADRQHQRREALDSRAHQAQEADKGRQQQTVLAKMTAQAKAKDAKASTPARK